MRRGARECGRVQEKVQAGVLASQHHETRRGETRRDEARRGEARHGITASRHHGIRDGETVSGETERLRDGAMERGRDVPRPLSAGSLASTASRGRFVLVSFESPIPAQMWRATVNGGATVQFLQASSKEPLTRQPPEPPGWRQDPCRQGERMVRAATSHKRAMRAVPHSLGRARSEVFRCH